jgi:GNAT superfamily N-acetyltransferase
VLRDPRRHAPGLPELLDEEDAVAMPEFAISEENDAPETDGMQLRDGLTAYNRRFSPDPEQTYRPLQLFVRDAEHRIVGGLVGEIYDTWLHISILWLDDAARGLGYGTQLIAMAEGRGREHGSTIVHLSTMSFQARPFYEKLGYELVAAVPYGNRHERFFMKKTL